MPRSLSTRSACRDKRSPVTSVSLTSLNRCLFTDALQFLCCVLGWAAPRPLGSFPSLTPGDRQFPARDEPLQSFFSQFRRRVQLSHLCVERVIGPVESKTAIRPAMNPQRPAYCIAKLPLTNCITSGMYLDAIGQVRALHRHSRRKSV
jgi:hypothetical protein